MENPYFKYFLKILTITKIGLLTNFIKMFGLGPFLILRILSYPCVLTVINGCWSDKIWPNSFLK